MARAESIRKPGRLYTVWVVCLCLLSLGVHLVHHVAPGISALNADRAAAPDQRASADSHELAHAAPVALHGGEALRRVPVHRTLPVTGWTPAPLTPPPLPA